MDPTLQTLVSQLGRQGASPGVIAFDTDRVVTRTYSKLAAESLRLASGLLKCGLKPGDRAAIVAINSADLVELRLAMIIACIVAVPLDDLAPPRHLSDMMRGAGVRALFTTTDLIVGMPDDIYHGLDVVVVLDDVAPPGARTLHSIASDDQPPLPVAAPDDVVAIIYTSGTTGTAKGVPLTHANFLANIDALVAGGYLDGRDRVLLPLPLHHAYPFMAGLMVPFSCGATVVLPQSVSGPDIATALREADVTVMAGVPRLYEAMADGLVARIAASGAVTALLFGGLLRLSTALRKATGWRAGRWLMRPVRARFAPKLRMLASGGAKLSEKAAWTLEGMGFEVLTGYGLVETSSVSTYNRRGQGRIGTEGKPGPGVELRIDTPDDSGVGEVHIRGPHVFAGYHGDPAATAEVFSPDGWFKTGDLGRLDSDGSLVVVGRSKEVIVLAGGKNVGPEEVERALTASRFIEDAAVLERDGDLAALIVPDIAALQQSGTARVDELMRIAVTESCVDLAPYQRVTGFRIWRQPLPKTRLGKLQRFALPDLYDRAESATAAPEEAEDMSAADHELLEQPAGRALVGLLRARFPDRTVSLDTSPQLDLGIDSLGWIEIAHEMEAQTGIALSEDMLAEVVTVRDLLGQVSAHQASDPGAPANIAEPSAPPQPTGAQIAFGWCLYWANRLIMRTTFRLRIRGAPPADPRRVLFVANHASDLDPMLIAAALPWRFARHCWWGGEVTRLYTTSLRRWLSRAAQIFPVDDRRPTYSLSQARELLERDECVVWFPESWRSADGRLQNFLRGVGVLVRESAPAVAPVWVEGSFDALPRHRRWPRLVRVTITFGPAVAAASLIPAGAYTDQAANIAAAARRLVATLQPDTIRLEAGDTATKDDQHVHGKPNT